MDFTDTFEIAELQPLRRRNAWRGVVGVKYPVEVDGRSMANGVRITVRIDYDDTGSVEGLLEAIYAEAKRCLSRAGEMLNSHPLGELLDIEEERQAELNKPFEISWEAMRPQDDE